MRRLINAINSRECEHCERTVLYQNDRFKAEKTKRGVMFALYGSCTELEASQEFYSWIQKNNKGKVCVQEKESL